MSFSVGSMLRRTRTTVTLPSREILRATRSATLLEGFGRRLRSTSGGIGIAKASGEDDYQKSYSVAEVNYFLSHSWHANWWLKYLTLLFYFNLIPAVCFATFVGLAVYSVRIALYRHKGWCEVMLASLSVSQGSVDSTCKTIVWLSRQCSVVLFGISTFCIVLFSWHHVRNALPEKWRTDHIFLDKVCIHQTDIRLKEQGIRSIGGVLANSRKLLVVWDPTYFARLWCCYEMSAYMIAEEESSHSVIVHPIALGEVSSFVILYQAGMEIAWFFILQLTDFHRSQARIYYCTLWFMMNLRVQWRFRRYLKAIADLHAQLATFSVRHTECFCCKSNHINPLNGQRLPCDREVVYNSIVHWQGADSIDEGLRDFDDMIRGSFKEFVGKTLETAVPIPYRVALAASTISTFSHADYHLLIMKRGNLTNVQLFLGFVNCQCLHMPLHFGILMVLLKGSDYQSTYFGRCLGLDTYFGRCLGQFVQAAICTFCLWISCTVKDMVVSYEKGTDENGIALTIFLVSEVLGVWWLFFAKSAKNDEEVESAEQEVRSVVELRRRFS